MEFKIDTKEKFTVVTPITSHLTANIAADLMRKCDDLLLQTIKNVVLNMGFVERIDENAVETIMNLQQQFYDNSASFVICNLTKQVDDQLEEMEIAEVLNITPTESEAWDIVQMEEIERELLDGDDVNFENNP
jgi:anti-anti-sigma factor